MLSSQEMTEDAVEREFPGMAQAEVQPLGGGLFSAIIFGDDGDETGLTVQAVATFQIRSVLVGEPAILSVAQRGA